MHVHLWLRGYIIEHSHVLPVPDINDHLQVTTSIYNLILGKLYVDHYGTMRIQGNRELSIKLKFKEQSIIDRNPHQVLSQSNTNLLH